MFSDITRFANPGVLWILLTVIPFVAYYVYRIRKGGAAIQISTVRGLENSPGTFKYYLRHLPFALLVSAFALWVVALARPQATEHSTTSETEGIDIILAIDVSTSMLARDLVPDRISAARDVASKFIVDRTNDRIGIVIFAGESFTQSPLTTDKKTLLNLMSQVRSGIVEDGTAIGNGLATAINRLRESNAESKVIILLTDGVNNMGQVTPLVAADIAKSFDIRVYTVGVGKRGMAPYPHYDIWGNMVLRPMKVEIDEDILREISSRTGGDYFRATDNESLSDIYKRIDQLERSRIETNEYVKYHEEYLQFLIAGLCLLIGAFLIRNLLLRRIP